MSKHKGGRPQGSRGGKGARALGIVRHFFPKVTSVVDAEKPLFIEVTQKDCDNSKVKDHTVCAMAVAAKRAQSADGVIMSVATAYVVKGTQATRFKLPPSTSREVVSFDRKGGFAPGTYELSCMSPAGRLDRETRGGGKDKEGRSKLTSRFHHRTTGIRTVLGGRRIA